MKTRSNWSQPKVWFGTKRNFSLVVRDQFKQIQKCIHSTKYSCIIHYFITFAAMHLSCHITCHGHTREAFPNAFLMDIKPDVIFVNGTRVIQCLSGVWKRHTIL